MITHAGHIVSRDLMDRLADLDGQQAQDFGLAKKERVADVIGNARGDAQDHWRIFQRHLEKPRDASAASETWQYWLDPFLKVLGYDPEVTVRGEMIDGVNFAISRRDKQLHSLPIHCVGANVNLDYRRPGVETFSPHNLVQEYLNRTDHVYGIVTNGIKFRLLRDSYRLRRQQYIEWDLRHIIEEDRYQEFAALFRLMHATRMPISPETAHTCWLEKYHKKSIDEGNRIRENLRIAVVIALREFGNGFLEHRDNTQLCEAIVSEQLTANTYNRLLRRLVYRLLFLMVAEERHLLFDEENKDLRSSAQMFTEHYSINRLRLLAARRHLCDGAATNLWYHLLDSFKIFEDDEVADAFGISPLDGELFHVDALGPLNTSTLTNQALLDAIHALSTHETEQKQRTRINYHDLDVEELGSVYESLLDMHPYFTGLNSDNPTFHYDISLERKETGSYYTRKDLVEQLILSTLDPVLSERLKAAGPEREVRELAILDLKVCDPAAGSGHFLLAAARRLAIALSSVRRGDDQQPTRNEYQSALHDVMEHCIYGVDLNPDAVELCQVSFWIEGHNPGTPLSFLSHKIRCGNSLIGVFDLAKLRDGIPEDAYQQHTGDNNEIVKSVKKENRNFQKTRQQTLFQATRDRIDTNISRVREAYRDIDQKGDLTIADRRDKEASYQAFKRDARLKHLYDACDLFTAAFFQNFNGPGGYITSETLAMHLSEGCDEKYIALARKLSRKQRFFHWPLEFPDVAEHGGFDVMVGKPPWEKIKLQEKEFFKTRDKEIAEAPNQAARRKLIKRLETNNPALFAAYRSALRDAEATSTFLRGSGRFPLTAYGDINTYSIFSGIFNNHVRREGRSGFIVPTGIATDDGNKQFFANLIEEQRLVSLFDFENRNALFRDVHRSYKFSLLTLCGGDYKEPKFAFFLHEVSDLQDDQRTFSLTKDDFHRINPNTLTCPIFRTQYDAELTKKIYRRHPVLINENEEEGGNPWGISFMRMFDMSTDSSYFRTRQQMEEEGYQLMGARLVKGSELWLPLYEAKMIWHYDHRYGSFEGFDERPGSQLPDATLEQKQDPAYVALPWYWVPAEEVEKRLEGKWERKWFLGFRDIARTTDVRTAIFSMIPFAGVGNNNPILFSQRAILDSVLIYAANCSIIADFIYRQKIGSTHLNFFYVKQIPMIRIDTETLSILSVIIELVYTSWDIKALVDEIWTACNDDFRSSICSQWQSNADQTGGHVWKPPKWADVYFEIDWQQKDNGCPLPPFKWDGDRRATIRAELDAYFARLYGLTREELLYVLDPQEVFGEDYPGETFRVLKEREIREYGEYRTKRLVMEAWDEMEGND